MKISSSFDSGNIEVIKADSYSDIQLKINNDSNSEFLQWFHYRLQGAKKSDLYNENYECLRNIICRRLERLQACASYDRQEWFRVPTDFDGTNLIINHTPNQDSVFYAYFTPYSYERHLDLLSKTQLSKVCKLEYLGNTVDGRDINIITSGKDNGSKKKVWVIARQHPGESMAEWFMEGLLDNFINHDYSLVNSLLEKAVFYIVPNMNPDGSYRGNLRSNAAGANLNREWMEPSVERSPEVYYVRQKMYETGVDLFIDVHGDEAIPYTFVACSEGTPSYNDRIKKPEAEFVKHYMRVSPDFQDEHGYPKDEPGKANLTIASAYVGEHFKCLSMTLEMPFKDHNNNPDKIYGWSAERSKNLGRSCLKVIDSIIDKL